MMEFTAPTLRTLKQEIGTVCSIVFNGTEMAVAIVKCDGEAVKEYKKADYNNYREMAKAIVEDYDGCEYKTAKIVNFEAVIILERNNNMNGVDNMKKAELRKELENYGVVLSNNEFKVTKHQELVERLELAIESSNTEVIKEEGEDNMNNTFTTEDLGALMAKSVTDSVKVAVEETVVPAVKNVVEDGNAKVLKELKNQLDTMNATIAGLVNRNLTTTPNRVSLGKCEDCGADIYSNQVINYSKANCGGHIYCFNHQASHRMQAQNTTNFGRQNQAPTNQVIHKYCMCCGTKTKYPNTESLNNSMKKAQGLGLKPIICKKCAEKILAERESQQEQVQQPVQQLSFGRYVPTQPVLSVTHDQGF